MAPSCRHGVINFGRWCGFISLIEECEGPITPPRLIILPWQNYSSPAKPIREKRSEGVPSAPDASRGKKEKRDMEMG